MTSKSPFCLNCSVILQFSEKELMSLLCEATECADEKTKN